MKSSINEIGNDVLACEALDSFFFKSSSSEVVVDPYSYHSFILSQHKLSSASAGTSSVPANDSVLLECPFSSEFYNEWKNEVAKNIPVDSLFQPVPIVPFPFKSQSNGDYTNIEDTDVEDIDLVVTTPKPDKQSSVNLFGPKNNVKVDNFVDEYDDIEGYIPSGVQLEVAGELTADYLIKQFEKDLLEEGSDVDGPDELKASNGVDTQDSRSGSSGHSSPSKPRTLIETYRAASGDDPEILDCESSIGSDIRTIDCGDSSDQDDGNENYNNSNRYYNHNQLPDLGFDGQLLASMQSASSSADDNDLIRFLTAHGGRLRGLYHNSHVPATTTITEPNDEDPFIGCDDVVPF